MNKKSELKPSDIFQNIPDKTARFNRAWPSLLGKQLWQDPGLKTDLMKPNLKLIRVNIKSRKVFVWISYVRQKESTSATWMTKNVPNSKRFVELLNLFLWKWFELTFHYAYWKKQNNYKRHRNLEYYEKLLYWNTETPKSQTRRNWSLRQPLENIIDTFKSDESIQRIKLANFHFSEAFNFCYAAGKKFLKLSCKNATRIGDIPATLLEGTSPR